MSDLVDVLIVEDNFGEAVAIEKFIESRKGYRVARCNLLSKAIPMLALNPRIIFLDLTLPDGSGETIVPEIRELLPDCKLVIWSAYIPPETEAYLRSLGVDDFLHKAQPGVMDAILSMLPPPRSAETEGS